jgi:PucR family transcriptional regulator, purine catabolism regulatory protein
MATDQTTTTSMTLEGILSAIPIESFRWVTGKDLASVTPINWISCEISDTEPGDLLLLGSDGKDHPDFPAALAGTASAIAIIGDMEIDRTWISSKPVVQFPDPSVFVSGNRTGIHAVQQLLLRTLLSQKSILLERGVQIQTRLTQIAAHGEGLTGLVAAMREMTQRGILVQDKRLLPIASSPSVSLRSIWDDLLEQLENFSTLPETLRDRRQAGKSPSIAVEELPGGLERAVVPIVVDDMARGYLSAIGIAGELDQTDRLVIEQGALVCAVEMARAKAMRETEKRLHGDLLSALLHQTLSARDARLWAQNMGLDLGQQHTALRMAWEAPAPSLRRLETLVNGEVARSGLRAIVSSVSAEVICICQSPHEAGRPAAAIDLAQAVVDLAAKEFPGAVVRCGIGTPASDLGEWQLSFRQAGQALDMARRLGERKPLYYMELSVYRLLLQLEDLPDLKAFLQETLGPILAHENADEFLDTLEEYFAHNGNLSQTAEALFIHRNTLTYRLNRIAAISRLNLDNPDTRLAVQLALRIRRMLAAQ